MKFDPPLLNGLLLRRYKRFLADIRLADGSEITVHCPNTGAMRGCSAPGSPAAISEAKNPRRKYHHTLEMVKMNGGWIGVNTALTNKLVMEAVAAGKVSQWQDVEKMKAEVTISKETRLDLQLFHQDGSNTLVEIKNCSLAEEGCAMFPDAVTVRGTKHLRTLQTLAAAGRKAAMLLLVQRMDADRFRPAWEIDPTYAAAFAEAQAAGVTILVYQAEVNPEGIEVVHQLPLAGDKEFPGVPLI